MPHVEPLVTTAAERFLTFLVDAQLYALRVQDVAEVIRIPALLARIPQGPPALLGIANLRGAILPVASLRELLGKPGATAISSARAIVLDIGAPIAVVVDSVETLETIAATQIETRKNELGADGAERLLGAFPTGRDNSVAKILDLRALLESAFSNRARAARKTFEPGVMAATRSADRNASGAEILVTFDIAEQEFALPVDVVQEILAAPSTVTALARAEAVVLGVISVRDSLLPILSLRGLLGLPAVQMTENREKVVVMTIAGTRIGLMVDQAREIVVANADLIDALPPVLAARTGGESRIRSIYRGEAGHRLISILAPEKLFREDVMQRLGAGAAGQASKASAAGSSDGAELIFLVFRLGDAEFGLPIDTVVEVARVPPQITRVPKAPKFLEGVVNLRGDVLPVVDQRRRFDMPVLENTEGRRLVVIRTEHHRAGLIVDSVSDVLRIAPASIEPPPDLTDATSRLVRGVINLEDSHRIILLLDPTEVLTRAEQSQLDTFDGASKRAKA